MRQIWDRFWIYCSCSCIPDTYTYPLVLSVRRVFYPYLWEKWFCFFFSFFLSGIFASPKSVLCEWVWLYYPTPERLVLFIWPIIITTVSPSAGTWVMLVSLPSPPGILLELLGGGVLQLLVSCMFCPVGTTWPENGVHMEKSRGMEERDAFLATETKTLHLPMLRVHSIKLPCNVI